MRRVVVQLSCQLISISSSWGGSHRSAVARRKKFRVGRANLQLGRIALGGMARLPTSKTLGVGGLLRNFPSQSVSKELRIMSKQKKSEKRAQRLKELQRLVEESGRINLQQYSSTHFRLFGPTVVDYWPGSGSCWLTGSNEKSTKMEPPEVIAMSLAEPLPPDAREHLDSIAKR